MCCETCKRNKDLESHHLIPKSNHANSWFKKNFTKYEMKNRRIDVCRDCHVAIHKRSNNKILGREFNTLDKILSDEKLINMFKFFSKQK